MAQRADGADSRTRERSKRPVKVAPAVRDARRVAATKRLVSMRFWLLGKGFHAALDAMNFAAGFHKGMRADGIDPEFDHQVAIAHYVRTLKGVRRLQKVLCAVFLHDVREDYGVEDRVVRDRWGGAVADAVECLTKVFGGVRKSAEAYFDAIAADAIASIAKGADRVHNLSTMVGPFSPAKQREYVAETKTWFLPMLKAARRRFTRQEAAYQNVKHAIVLQLDLLDALHAAPARV